MEKTYNLSYFRGCLDDHKEFLEKIYCILDFRNYLDKVIIYIEI